MTPGFKFQIPNTLDGDEQLELNKHMFDLREAGKIKELHQDITEDASRFLRFQIPENIPLLEVSQIMDSIRKRFFILIETD